MKTKVAYYTKSGNTKKIADAIASEMGCECVNMDTPVNEELDLLFLGASVYKFGIDKKVLDFIDTLKPQNIGNIAIFSTSAMSDTGYPKLVDILTKKGFKVSDKHFYCRGQFWIANKNLPDENDVKKAKEFASKFM